MQTHKDDTLISYEENYERVNVHAINERLQHLSPDQQAYVLHIVDDLAHLMSREERSVAIMW